MTNKINFLPPWVETNLQPAFYDVESGTVLQQTARMYDKVNQLVRNVNEQNETIKEYVDQFVELRNYVENYFEDLDVQAEINAKLDTMASDGSLLALIKPYIDINFEEIKDSLEHSIDSQNEKIDAQDGSIESIANQVGALTSSAPIPVSSTSDMTDTTKIYVNTSDGKWYYYDGANWTIGGIYQASVDSDDLSYLKKQLDAGVTDIDINYQLNWIDGYRLTNGEGTPYASAGNSITDFIPVFDGYFLNVINAVSGDYNRVALYDKDKNYLNKYIGLTTKFNILNCITKDTKYVRLCVQTSNKAIIGLTIRSYLSNRFVKHETFTDYKYERVYYNHNINTNANIGDVVDLTGSDVSNWWCEIIPCEGGDKFFIKGNNSGTNPKPWAFLDSTNHLLEKSPDYGGNFERYATAPSGTAKVVINLYDDGSNWDNTTIIKVNAKNFNRIDHGYNFANNFFNNKVINTNKAIGYHMNMTPVTSMGFKCSIVDVKPDEEYYISGTGGQNPKLWAFVNVTNDLLSRSTETPYQHHSEIVKVPHNATRMICNFSLDDTSEIYLINSIDSIKDKLALNESANYPIQKDSPSTQGCAFVRGINTRHELIAPLTDFKYVDDLMCHVGTFKIVNDIVYATYYGSTTSTVEDPTQQTVRFVYAPLNNLSNKTYKKIMTVGDVYDSKTVTKVYDTILAQVDSTTLRIMWACALDNTYVRLYQDYDITTGTYGTISYNHISIDGSSSTMTVPNLISLLDTKGYEHKPVTDDIGIMQKFTSRVEGDVTYYYTGLYAGQFNCIVKTSDFDTFILVSIPNFENESLFENACYLKNNKVYYFMRQKNTNPYGLLTYFDLQSYTWAKPVRVNDCQSRSDFFEINNSLYLIHAPNSRDELSIMKVDGNLINSTEYNSISVWQSFYPYVDIYNSHNYMIYTQNRQHMYFAEFTLGDNDFNVSNYLYKIINS